MPSPDQARLVTEMLRERSQVPDHVNSVGGGACPRGLGEVGVILCVCVCYVCARARGGTVEDRGGARMFLNNVWDHTQRTADRQDALHIGARRGTAHPGVAAAAGPLYLCIPD